MPVHVGQTMTGRDVDVDLYGLSMDRASQRLVVPGR